jgi:hypothetical protein
MIDAGIRAANFRNVIFARLESKFFSMCLPKMELVAYIPAMRTRGRGLLRTAIAVVFGFMSLVHGPVMTFAKASPAPAQHVNPHGAHHHPTPAQDSLPVQPDSAPVCYAFGCFTALDAVAVAAPTAILNPIGALLPARTKALRAGNIEPAVPPPRHQV